MTIFESAPASAGGAPPGEPQSYAVEFTGNGREYFRIWIVNVLLSVVTLGIYSAWAKVRRLQYFHRNTRVGGSGFDYHGDPVAILKGRLIAIVFFAIYFGAGLVGPLVGLAAVGVLMLFMPWVMARSLRFRMHNTSYRGVRFRFRGSVRSAYWVFLGLPLLAILSLFTLVPFAQHRAKRYQYEHSALGRTAFTFGAPVGEFYLAFIGAAFISGVILAVGIFGVVFVGALIHVSSRTPGGGAPPDLPPALLPLFFIVYAIGIVAGQAFATARIQNTVWQSTRLGPHRFDSRLGVGRLFVILFTNLALTVFTLGAYRPFAQVRLASYLASAMSVITAASLDDFSAGDEGAVSAVGEEAAELFDFDIGF